jgi:ribosomal protein L32
MAARDVCRFRFNVPQNFAILTPGIFRPGMWTDLPTKKVTGQKTSMRRAILAIQLCPENARHCPETGHHGTSKFYRQRNPWEDQRLVKLVLPDARAFSPALGVERRWGDEVERWREKNGFPFFCLYVELPSRLGP